MTSELNQRLSDLCMYTNSVSSPNKTIQQHKYIEILLTTGLISMWLIGYRAPNNSGIFLGDGIALITLLIAFIYSAYKGGISNFIPPAPSILVISIIGILCIYWTYLPYFQARAFYRDIVQYTFYLYFTWCAAKLITNKDRAFTLSTIITACIIGIQLISYYLSFSSPFEWIANKVDWLWISGHSDITEWEGTLMLSSLFQHRNQLAIFTAALYVYFLFQNRYGFSMLVGAACLLSGSRTGLAIIILVTIGYVIINFKNSHRSALIGLALLAVLIVGILCFGDAIIQKFKMYLLPNGDGSTNYRISIFRQGLQIIGKHSLTGIGIGQIKNVSGFDNFENSLLQIVMQLGVPASTLLFTVFIYKATKAKLFKLNPLALMCTATLLMSFLHPFLLQSQIAPFFIFTYFAMLQTQSDEVEQSSKSDAR
jgi:O-antigen ligase